MNKIRTLIIGLGKIGFEYDKNIFKNSQILSHSKAIKNNKNYELVAGVDINKKKRNLFRKKYNVEVFKSIKDCLKTTSVDLAIIAIPTHAQFKIFKSLANEDIKNIICEKPIADKVYEAKKILKLSNQKKINVAVNYVRRYNPAIIELKKKFDKDLLGKVFNGFFWYKENLKHGGCHFVDLILFLFGKPSSVQILDKIKSISPNLLFTFKNFKIYLFSTPKAKYEIGKFEIQTSSNIITYEDDKDIKIFQNINNKLFKKEKKLVLKEKISYKKNVNIKFLYDEFNRSIKKKFNNTNLKDSIYNLKLCSFL